MKSFQSGTPWNESINGLVSQIVDPDETNPAQLLQRSQLEHRHVRKQGTILAALSKKFVQKAGKEKYPLARSIYFSRVQDLAS